MQACTLSCCLTIAIRILFVCIFDVYYVMSSEVITLLSFNKNFFQVVLSFWMERPKQKKRKNRILSCHISAFMLEAAYVEVLSLNNLQFSGLRPCRRKMKIFKATLHKRSCYSGGNRTIWGSNCWEPWNFFSSREKVRFPERGTGGRKIKSSPQT